jgi:hypothetical protein
VESQPPTFAPYESIRLDGTDAHGHQQWGFVDENGFLRGCWITQEAAQAAADTANPEIATKKTAD